MTCEFVRDAMSEYLDGMLSAEDVTSFEAHLAACRECRQRVCEMRETLDWIQQAGELTPPESLRPSVLNRLRSEQARAKRRFAPGWSQAAAAAVIFLLLAAGNLSPSLTPDGFGPRAMTKSGAPAEEYTINNAMTDDVDTAGGELQTADNETTQESAQPPAGGDAAPTTGRNIYLWLYNLILIPLFLAFTLLALRKRREAMP
jgi:predicted anti-sigma-YlaC factor YlaD